jgi:hypothetical protein
MAVNTVYMTHHGVWRAISLAKLVSGFDSFYGVLRQLQPPKVQPEKERQLQARQDSE